MSSFSFPVEQVQTVYRLLVRAEPGLLERLCMSIREEEADKDEEDREWPGHKQRKDDTSKVLVYNSYIYPTLGKGHSVTCQHRIHSAVMCCSISFHFNCADEKH